MKLTVLCFCLVSFAMANCPDLTGSYTCTDNFGDSYNQVIQAAGNKYIVEDADGVFEIVADGKEIPYVFEGEGFSVTATTKSSCLAGLFIMELSGDITTDEGFTAPISSKSISKLTDSGYETASTTIVAGEIEHGLDTCVKN